MGRGFRGAAKRPRVESSSSERQDESEESMSRSGGARGWPPNLPAPDPTPPSLAKGSEPPEEPTSTEDGDGAFCLLRTNPVAAGRLHSR